MFKKAIVKVPAKSISEGISSASLGNPDYVKALVQHKKYVEALEKCGLDVFQLEPDEKFPDSTFVEDTALCTPECAIITNPGAETRNNETTAIKEELKNHYKIIEEIKSPGTIDAGDIMMVGKHFYIGLSDRTNNEGADQMITILEKYGMTGSKVEMSEMLHLKTGVNYIENNNLLAAGEFLQKDEFKKFNIIPIEKEEEYAANSLWINGTVIVPAGYPKTLEKIQNLGYETIEVDTSEFRKIDGGLSCLSLRF